MAATLYGSIKGYKEIEDFRIAVERASAWDALQMTQQVEWEITSRGLPLAMGNYDCFASPMGKRGNE